MIRSFRPSTEYLIIPASTHSIIIPKRQKLLLYPSNSSKITIKPLVSSHQETTISTENKRESFEATVPSMSDILESSRAQKLDIRLQKLGPFFRITAISLQTQKELGRAEGLIRVWFGGKILHLDSIRLQRETLGMEKSIFGIGLFIGAVAIRYGYDCGCKSAQLLAINDSDLYHQKVLICFLFNSGATYCFFFVFDFS